MVDICSVRGPRIVHRFDPLKRFSAQHRRWSRERKLLSFIRGGDWLSQAAVASFLVLPILVGASPGFLTARLTPKQGNFIFRRGILRKERSKETRGLGSDRQ
jgi:hypothetical protein